MRIKRAQKRLLSVFVVIILMTFGFLVVFAPQYVGINKVKLNIAPNYNGYHMDFFGIQLPGSQTVYTANNPNPCLNVQSCPWVSSISSNGQIGTTPYSWFYNTQSATLKYCPSACSTIQVATNVYNPNNNPLTGSPSLGTASWQVPWPQGCSWGQSGCALVKTSGNLYTQNAQVQLTVQQGSDYNTEWQGVTLWFRGYSTNYNRAYPVSGLLTLPNGTVIGTWATVVAQTISSAAIACPNGTCGSTVSTSPSYTVTQYVMNDFTVPQTSSSYFVPYNQNNAGQYIQNGNPLSPDTQMYQETFFAITLVNFGSYGYGQGFQCGFISCEGDPQMTFNFQTWLLQMGQYILQNPNTQSFSTTTYPTTACSNVFCGNLFSMSGLFTLIFGTIIIVAVVFVILQLLKRNPAVTILKGGAGIV